MKRKIEIFTAGCPVCNPAVQLVKETSCENCEIEVYNLVKQAEDKACIAKVEKYNIKRLPSVVVNGELLACCRSNEITKKDLIAAGVGQA